MNRSLSRRILEEIPKRLADLLGVPLDRVLVRGGHGSHHGRENEADLVLESISHRFVIEYKAEGTVAPVSAAIRQVLASSGGGRQKAIPTVVVPYMGMVGQRLCAEAKVSWLDLSGNAHIQGPGLRICIEGRSNQFKRPGRPANLFAPKSARLARWLLIHPKQAFTQRELARATDVNEGLASRVVHALEERNLVGRETNGAVRVRDPKALLDAWREVYDFSKHRITRGHVSARSSDEILRQVASAFKADGINHAATGLGAAWLFTQFAGFRLVVFYVGQDPGTELRKRISFHEEERGENVWLVVPNDEGVFHGVSEREGIRCVHPVQVYLDLKDHPERSSEAAEELRRRQLMDKEPHA